MNLIGNRVDNRCVVHVGKGDGDSGCIGEMPAFLCDLEGEGKGGGGFKIQGSGIIHTNLPIGIHGKGIF